METSVNSSRKGSKQAPSRAYFRGQEDAKRYKRLSLSYLFTMYGVLGLILAEWAPVWLIVVVIPPVYVRTALSTHELMHLCRATQVSVLHRLMMVLETPICLGYREHRDIHIRHHRFAATERDPEFFQIRGGHLRAFASAMLAPEWSLLAYLREKGASRIFLAEASVRLGGFFLALWLNPRVFLWYWITIRASAGVSAYMFNHLLHYQKGGYGTFRLQPPRALDGALRELLGAESVQILFEHPAHHAWQQVKAGYLPDLSVDAEKRPIATAVA